MGCCKVQSIVSTGIARSRPVYVKVGLSIVRSCPVKVEFHRVQLCLVMAKLSKVKVK